MPLETLSQATLRLSRDGYTASFRAEADGLRELGSDRVAPPEAFELDEVVRFEGMSDPSDEAILFALRSPEGVRGTFVATYGPEAPATEAEMAKRLSAREAR